MIKIAFYNGFACGQEHKGNEFVYHHTNTLRKFALGRWHGMDIKSKYNNLGAYHDDIGISLPRPYSPVCYSGNFAAKASAIYSKRNIWDKLEQSLTRNDNIEEGHFAERSFAGILTKPMSSKQLDTLKSLPTMTQTAPGHGYLGYLAYNPPDDGKSRDKLWLNI